MSSSVPKMEMIIYIYTHVCATGEHPFFEDVLLVEFMYLLFTRIPGESYRAN